MVPINLRAIQPKDRKWVRQTLTQRWHSPCVVTRGVLHEADKLPGLIAVRGPCPVGLATYRLAGDQCELVTLDSLDEGRGVGTALLSAVSEVARAAGCRRLWLITTNDNLSAVRFYQKRGLVLAALHRDALENSRTLKPEIPLIGADGIPLRDELELELML